jgi:hypothetical protein
MPRRAWTICCGLVVAACCTAAGGARAETGVLFVKSTPPGAEIAIDGIVTSWRTPRVVGDVAPGAHVVLLRLDGYAPARADVIAEAGRIVTVDLALAASAPAANATLRIVSEPLGATVWVDVIERGTTPLTVAQLAPGTHKIVAMLEGYQLVETEASVGANADETVRLTLARENADAAAAGVDERSVTPAPAGPTAKDEVPKTVDISCPYCSGTGMLTHMGCSRCVRTGVVGFDECPACRGPGKVEMSCVACAGHGKVISGGREIECRACRGKKHPVCPACKGSGSIAKPNPAAAKQPTAACAACNGGGFEQNTSCHPCRGTGTISLGAIRTGWFTAVERKQKCKLCDGDGNGPPVCPKCRGRGSQGSPAHAKMCDGCFGTGHRHAACGTCGGRGFIPVK